MAFTHWGFDDDVHEGRLVVNAQEAEAVRRLLGELFQAGYPIYSAIPIGELPEDSEERSDYANTSGFHCRVVEGTNRWSEHARGLAIDINPHLNPLLDGETVWPADAGGYVDRSLGEVGMIVDGDVVVEAFAAIGWKWGGHWTTLKDYHHFSASGR